MNILNGIQNFLEMLNENWTTIIVIIGLSIALGNRIVEYINLTNDEKIEIAKKQVSEIILKLISDAENDYAELNKAGSIKRAQVIEEVFKRYPVLSKVANQDSVIAWIDNEIDDSLKTLRDIISKNTTNE